MQNLLYLCTLIWYNMQRTEIATMGEFGLIKHLTKDITPVQPSTKKGVGDDCAVMDFGSKKVLMTTDMLLEGIHFNLEYVPLKHLGYKAAVVNFSDIYAMNGTPTQITVSLGISKRFSVEAKTAERAFEKRDEASRVFRVKDAVDQTVEIACNGIKHKGSGFGNLVIDSPFLESLLDVHLI